MQKLNLFWKGRMPLECVTWKFNPHKELELNPTLEKKRLNIWEETIQNYPDTYDGHLLVLDNMKITPNTLHLETAFTTFSRVLALERLHLGFKYGCLGVQALIFSPDKRRILIGQRAEELMYCPLYYGGPGGMLEVADASLSFDVAIMREIEEEVRLEFQYQKNLIAITKDVYTKVGTCLLIESIASEEVDFNAPVEGNEEWMDNQLEWYHIEKLHDFDGRLCLESPIFAGRELLAYEMGQDSVIWTQQHKEIN
jgi:8-oxo-dGTP pyrophosphatase MutT (NUDIX family)